MICRPGYLLFSTSVCVSHQFRTCGALPVPVPEKWKTTDKVRYFLHASLGEDAAEGEVSLRRPAQRNRGDVSGCVCCMPMPLLSIATCESSMGLPAALFARATAA